MSKEDEAEISPQRNRWATGRSRSQYATARRLALVKVLAPPNADGMCTCAGPCKKLFHPSDLEIDHVDKITWNARKLNAWRRAARYWREYEEGVPLRVLCRSCNATDGNRRRWRRWT